MAITPHEGAMALVGVIEGEDAAQPLFVAEFDFSPHVSEHIARDTYGSSQQENIKICHRQDTEDRAFRACSLVTLDD